jgi:pilus assembly protein TadC
MGTAVALALQRPQVRDRLGHLLPAPVVARGEALTRNRHLLCVAAGATAWWVVGGNAGMALGIALAAAGPEALARLEDRSGREEKELVQQLPLALDLVAACLAGGGSLAHALRSVSHALRGPCGLRLGRVAAALDVGTPAEQAFAELGAVGAAGSASRALCRASEGGMPVAAAVARVAEDCRRTARSEARRRARRAGVMAAAPLTTCFLPAFLLLGIVPCAVGVVGPLMAAL